MNGAECLLRTLLANRIDTCFMNPGTSEMQFVAALDRVAGMRGVLGLFEGVCSGAADGYARMTGRPAATLLHLGPGLGNALANLHNARKARVPLVSIVGEHSTQHLKFDAPLTADIEAFARTVSDAVCTVRDPSDMGKAAAETVAASLRPPGHIATLVVPADISWTEAGVPGPALDAPCRIAPGAELVDRTAELLGDGPQTALMLSGSALLARGIEAAGRIAAATGARVYANRNAARLHSGRGCFQPKRIPYFPEPAEAALAGLKHMILVEARPPVSFFGYPGKRSYLAPDECEMHVLAALHEDGAAALEAVAAELGAPAPAAPPPSAPDRLPADGSLTLEAIGRTIATLLPDGAIVSDEMVSSGEAIWPYLLKSAPHDHLPVSGGSIGQGLPVALGAAVACPQRKVVALEADGSAMYTLQALWTMARERADVTVVVFANRRYRILDIEMQRTGAHGFGAIANDMIDISRPDLDFVRLAEGLGVAAVRAQTAGEFVTQFGFAMRNRGPVLIEAVLP